MYIAHLINRTTDITVNLVGSNVPMTDFNKNNIPTALHPRDKLTNTYTNEDLARLPN